MDVLDVAQRAPRCNLPPVLSVGSLLTGALSKTGLPRVISTPLWSGWYRSREAL